MPLSCGSGDPSREEISKGFVLLRKNVVWGLVGFDRAFLTLPFFSYCEVLAGKAQAAALQEMGRSGLGWAFGYVQKRLALEQGISQSHAPAGPGEESDNPDIAGLLPTASVLCLFLPKKHPKQGAALQSPVGRCL